MGLQLHSQLDLRGLEEDPMARDRRRAAGLGVQEVRQGAARLGQGDPCLGRLQRC